MCGIAGFAHFDSGMVNKQIVRDVSTAMVHRGPDDLGYLSWQAGQSANVTRDFSWIGEPQVILVHRRLSIIDLSNEGAQPMSTADGRYHIVFNGEIYNYVELREELIAAGVTFKSTSDTEVALYAFAEWGTRAFGRFIGMFAIAILDSQTGSVILSRDQFGIKPLFYTTSPSGTFFASELKALLKIPSIERKVNPQVLFDFLVSGRSDFGAETLIAGIKQVPPASFIEFQANQAGESQPQSYWHIKPRQSGIANYRDAVDELRHLFLESVRLHMRSDVAVGACLSGGIDSSSIVMAMRHIGGKDLDIHTFSYIADREAINEERWVDIVCDAARTVPHKIHVESDAILDELDALIYTQDEPFRGTSMYAQYLIFREARRHGIKVMLDGQGADEMLAGYQGTMHPLMLALMVEDQDYVAASRFVLGVCGLRNLGAVPELYQRAKRLIKNKRTFRTRPVEPSDSMGPGWLNHGWFARHEVQQASGYTDEENEYGLFRGELHRMLTTSSMPHLLRSEDRNSMAWSVESRVPFVNPVLVEFLMSLPEKWLLNQSGVTKSIFRDAMRDIVPKAILDRKDKIGFTTPIDKWLGSLHGWIEPSLTSARTDSDSPVYPSLIEESLRLMQLRSQMGVPQALWRSINYLKWQETFSIQAH